jgi:hypothetical protein
MEQLGSHCRDCYEILYFIIFGKSVEKIKVVSSYVVRETPVHNILSTDPQLSISQKALGTLPKDGNVMPKHVGATIDN